MVRQVTTGATQTSRTRSQALLGNAAPEALLHNPEANVVVVRRDVQERETQVEWAEVTSVPAERSSEDCIPKQSLGTRAKNGLPSTLA